MAGLNNYFFVCMFGSSTWLTINAIWVELSLYTSKLPESWSLPSYLAAIIQLACVGPLLYSVLHKCVGLHIKKPPLILALLLLSTVSMLVLALCWENTVFIFGAQHSVAIFSLTFLMALVSATSNVLFLPFMATFHPHYLTAYFVGMSFSSLVPSVLKLIQGVGNYECIPSAVPDPNGTLPSSPAFVAVQTEPLFHIRMYNLAMFAWMCAATASFGVLYWNGRKKATRTTTKKRATILLKGGQKQKLEDHGDGDQSGDGGGHSTTAQGRQRAKAETRMGSEKPEGDEDEAVEEDEWRREQSPLKSSKTSVGGGKRDNGETHCEPTASGAPGGGKGDDKLRYWTLIVCLALICAEMNTIIPSIQSYATLAYSLLTYHLALTLSNLSHPLANFLPLWLKPRSLSTVLALVTICTVGTLFIFMLALQSPEPIFRDTAPHLGSAFAIILSVFTGFLCSYLRTHITGLIRGEHPDSESLLFWCGVFMQRRVSGFLTLSVTALETSQLFVSSTDLYPTVSLAYNALIATNFGPKFNYSIPKLFFVEQPTNRWNLDDCHKDILSIADQPLFRAWGDCGIKPEYYGCARSCRAEAMISHYTGIFYFEIKLIKKPGQSAFSMGLSTRQMPLNESVWDNKHNGTHAYYNYGFYDRLPEFICADCMQEYHPPAFGVGDVVGCGVNLATRQIIYTLNGKRLDTSKLFVNTTDLYPTVSLSYHSIVEANFGPKFRYDISIHY